jgi:hypothetical protein
MNDRLISQTRDLTSSGKDIFLPSLGSVLGLEPISATHGRARTPSIGRNDGRRHNRHAREAVTGDARLLSPVKDGKMLQGASIAANGLPSPRFSMHCGQNHPAASSATTTPARSGSRSCGRHGVLRTGDRPRSSSRTRCCRDSRGATPRCPAGLPTFGIILVDREHGAL